MAILKIRKVNTLPGTLEASTLYMVKSSNPNLFDLYLSTSDGLTARHIISQTEISTMITDAVGVFNTVEIVADITARDALTPGANIQVLVLDASADATVISGAALYVYDFATTTWYKVSEYESMDVVLDWASIQNKPTSTPAQIDQAVSDSHTHANKALLDLLSEVSGHLHYNGEPVRTYLDEEAW